MIQRLINYIFPPAIPLWMNVKFKDKDIVMLSLCEFYAANKQYESICSNAIDELMHSHGYTDPNELWLDCDKDKQIDFIEKLDKFSKDQANYAFIQSAINELKLWLNH